MRRLEDPQHESLRKATRVVVVACTSFLVGRYVIADSQFTVLATFTAVSLTGIANLSGSLKDRALANAVATAVGLGLVSIGTWVSRSTPEAAVAMFIVVFVVSFSGIFSGYFSAGGNAVILFYLVASGIPAPVGVIGARLEGVAFAGALATVASVTLWPLPFRETTSRKLAASLDSIKDLVSLVGPADRPDGAVLDAMLERGREAVTAAKVGVLATRGRVGGPTAVQRAQAYLFHGCDRMVDLCTRLGDLGPAFSSRTVPPELTGAVSELQGLLGCCAASLRQEAPPPDVDYALGVRTRLRRVVRPLLESMMSQGGQQQLFWLEADRSFVMEELATAVVLATAHTRMATRVDKVIDPRVFYGAGSPVARSAMPSTSSWAKWTRRARANLEAGSVHLHNSLRLAAGLCLARVLVGVLDLQHGFWVAFSTLTVLRSSASATTATALEAVAGTLVGFGATTVMALAFGDHGGAYFAALPIVLFLAFYAAGVFSFLVGQALFTIMIVVLFNILQPEGWRVGLLRVEDVTAGVAIGIVIGFAIWPRGASAQLGRACADLLTAAAAYTWATLSALLSNVVEVPAGNPGRLEQARKLALDTAVRAEDVFAQYLVEHRDPENLVRSWAALLFGGHRLWISADSMAQEPKAAAPNTACEDLGRALVALGRSVRSGYERLATRLRGELAPVPGRDPGAPYRFDGVASRCYSSMADVGDPASLHQALILFRARSWLDELSDDLESLDPIVPEVSRRLHVPVPDGAGASREPDRAVRQAHR